LQNSIGKLINILNAWYKLYSKIENSEQTFMNDREISTDNISKYLRDALSVHNDLK